MKAIAIRRRKYLLPDGSIVEIVIWQLPHPTTERPHGYKYRLNYSLANGTTIVRFDNETGKGDHKHILGIEYPYQFKSIDQLLADFRKDINEHGGMI